MPEALLTHFWLGNQRETRTAAAAVVDCEALVNSAAAPRPAGASAAASGPLEPLAWTLPLLPPRGSQPR